MDEKGLNISEVYSPLEEEGKPELIVANVSQFIPSLLI